MADKADSDSELKVPPPPPVTSQEGSTLKSERLTTEYCSGSQTTGQ